MAERKFILQWKLAPGDVLMLSGLVRDLKTAFGDRYAVDVRTNFPAIWRHNPNLTPINDKDPKAERIKVDYSKGIKLASRQKIHFLTEFYRDFQRKTGITVPCLVPWPDIHLSAEEKSKPFVSGRYWIIVPGGKKDFTIKIWPQYRYQEVVDRLRPWGLRFVQEGAKKPLHIHHPLERALDLRGKTSIRDLICNIYHAEGVICGVTFPMHIAAALEKPCVVIAGGREEAHWEAYVNGFKAFGPDAAQVRVPHQYLHTMGQLPCCERKGCWLHRVYPLNDHLGRPPFDKRLCHKPVKDAGHGESAAKCMDMISVDHVVEAVMSYYSEGFLPPPQFPKSAAVGY